MNQIPDLQLLETNKYIKMSLNKTANRMKIKLVAYTDAAGRYNPDLVNEGNEDNFYVDDDLTDDINRKTGQDEIVELGTKGCLMVVADGMGGMNAGEVASKITVDMVSKSFKSEKLTDDVIKDSDSRASFMEEVVRRADKEIKRQADEDSSKKGMGSTIVMAWLFENELTLCWCGDSRAYLYNSDNGIILISKDHSTVQEWVDKGLITYDEAFDHPMNNIITRSLGDPNGQARPESKTLTVGKGDIILLCSDGLSGVLRDKKSFDKNGKLYPEKNIEDIIQSHCDSMSECRKALWDAAEKGGWTDNVTAILCKVEEGPESQGVSRVETSSLKKNITTFTIIILLSLFVAGLYCFNFKSTDDSPNAERESVADSLPNDSKSTEESDNSKATSNFYEEFKTPKTERKTHKNTENKVTPTADNHKEDNVLTEINESDNTLNNIIKTDSISKRDSIMKDTVKIGNTKIDSTKIEKK